MDTISENGQRSRINLVGGSCEIRNCYLNVLMNHLLFSILFTFLTILPSTEVNKHTLQNLRCIFISKFLNSVSILVPCVNPVNGFVLTHQKTARTTPCNTVWRVFLRFLCLYGGEGERVHHMFKRLTNPDLSLAISDIVTMKTFDQDIKNYNLVNFQIIWLYPLSHLFCSVFGKVFLFSTQ